jgi:biopolymer transport protein TolR
MAFSMNTSNRAPMSEINVTPLVDVMLVLLIIFMVTAPMMQEGVAVDLPQATGSPLDKKQEAEQIFITVAGPDKILVNEVAVPEDQLVNKIVEATKKNPLTAVNLRADKNVPYGVFVRIMGALTSAGIKDINLITSPQEKTVH